MAMAIGAAMEMEARREAKADDNGQTVELNPGDTLLTGDGAGHSIESIGDEPLVIMAVISRFE